MGTEVKIRCPYCHSDDCYQDKATSMKNILGQFVSLFGRSRGLFQFKTEKPDLNTYHCFNCGKDFTKK